MAVRAPFVRTLKRGNAARPLSVLMFSWLCSLCAESPNGLFQFRETLLQFRVLGAGFFQLLVQPLNRRQRRAVGIHGGDAGVALADFKRGFEILRHRPDVPDT